MRACVLCLALQCAERSTICAAVATRRRLDRGVFSLKAIAYVAPLLGAFTTTKELIEGLTRYDLRYCNYADCADSLAETFFPLLLSFPLAILAYYTFHFLERQIEGLDLEMKTAALDLLNNLARTRL